jgi:hydroxypyruvate isomerase
MRIRQSICIGPFTKGGALLTDDFLKELKAIGYAAIELVPKKDDFRDAVARARAQGLEVASMVGHASLKDGLNNRDNHDRIEAELRQSIDDAVALGIPNLLCLAGNRVPRQSDLEALEVAALGLLRVARYAEQKGVTLNVELLNSKVNHPDYQCDRTDWGIALCRRVASPRVKLVYDIYHMAIMEGDIIRTIQKYGEFFGHYHTAGNPGRNDPDETQELNYAAICKTIAASPYAGYVSHEYSPKGDVLASLQKAFAICDQQ